LIDYVSGHYLLKYSAVWIIHNQPVNQCVKTRIKRARISSDKQNNGCTSLNKQYLITGFCYTGVVRMNKPVYACRSIC